MTTKNKIMFEDAQMSESMVEYLKIFKDIKRTTKYEYQTRKFQCKKCGKSIEMHSDLKIPDLKRCPSCGTPYNCILKKGDIKE